MIPVPETVNGNAWSACVASILERSIGLVPHFYQVRPRGDEKAWWRAVDWLREQGWSMLCFQWPLAPGMQRLLAGQMCILSEQGKHDAIVARVGLGEGEFELLHRPRLTPPTEEIVYDLIEVLIPHQSVGRPYYAVAERIIGPYPTLERADLARKEAGWSAELGEIATDYADACRRMFRNRAERQRQEGGDDD